MMPDDDTTQCSEDGCDEVGNNVIFDGSRYLYLCGEHKGKYGASVE